MLGRRGATLTGIILLILPGYAQGAPFILSAFDKQAHMTVAFQSVVTLGMMLESLEMSKLGSAATASGATLFATLGKELWIDANYSPTDVTASVLGAALGVAVISLWPLSHGKGHSKSRLTFEPAGGLIHFEAIQSSSPDQATPDSLMVQAQTTFWLDHSVGLHAFSGGMTNIHNDDSSKRLLFGWGARVSVYPLPFSKKVHSSSFSVRAGLDYGFLLFSTNQNNVPYTASAYVPFYSLDAKWHPNFTRLLVAAQISVVNYEKNLLIAPGVRIGFEF